MWALPTAGGDFLHNYNTFGSEAQQISLCGVSCTKGNDLS